MTIEFYCPIWGSESMDFDDFAARVSDAGYDGVEMSFPGMDPGERERRVSILGSRGLKLIAQHWETENTDPDGHTKEYVEILRILAGLNPEFISSQTGRDFFEFEDNLRILSVAADVAEETGVRIVHETHRSKLTFAAHVTRRFLEKLPQMRLTLDMSHWVCVHERLLQDQAETMALVIERTDHIHARVGHIEGSQVSDFRKPEWQEDLEVHLKTWDKVREAAISAGRDRLTVSPEFGPWPYMMVTPGTDEPVADQWTLNREMMTLLRDRWS